MRSFLAFLLFLGFLLFAVVARWHFVCEMRQLCGEEPVEIEDLRLKTLQLIEADSILLDGYDHFAFDSASFRVQLNENNVSFLDTLVTFMQADSLRNLRITAFSLFEEGGFTGIQETMGLARAKAIRDELVKRGVNESSIEIIGEELAAGLALDQPASFEFYTKNPDEYNAPANTFFNMTYDGEANFKKNSDEFNPAAPLRLYADSVKMYFEEHPAYNLNIIGHADSDGTSKYNLGLGKRRANNAKAYFVEIGVPEERITTKSKGESEPLLPNTSEKNMLKNRRVQFRIE